MHYTLNPLYIILGLAALYYVPTLLSVLKLDIKFKSLVPLSINENEITLQAGLQLTNNSSTSIRLNRMNVQVLLNGTFIGTIQQNLNIPLLPGRAQVIPANLQITPDNLGAQLWQDAINQNLQNFVFELSGTITANNKPYPFNSTWTINDFINTK